MHDDLHESAPDSGAPAFSIHDPAFESDPRLARLRRGLKVSLVSFVLGMTLGLGGALFLLGPVLEGGASAWQHLGLWALGGFCVLSTTAFAAFSSATHRALRAHYGGRPG